jgi:hypothetical protein
VGALVRQLVQKLVQLRCRLELRHRIKLLERAGEGVGQTPHRTRRELLVLRLEVQPVDLGQQTPGRVQLAIDKGRIEDQLRAFIGDLRLPPVFDLALQGLEIPLDSVYAYRECVNQVEALGVLGQDRREHARDNVSKF